MEAETAANPKQNCEMQKGLTKKLDYEKAKLKSKAANPDYRDRFTEEGEGFDRGGAPQQHLTLADAVKGDFSKIVRDDKMKAIEFYRRKLRSLRVKVDRWIFKFKFAPDEFAKENSITPLEAKKVLPEVKADAENRLTITLGRAQKAALEVVTGETRPVWRLRFRTFLPTVEPILWSKIYKRVELCPMEQENDA